MKLFTVLTLFLIVALMTFVIVDVEGKKGGEKRGENFIDYES
jgi:hypothetical protein